ncbi:MAG: helix-turn-helix domain-containing protein [Myxococcota bacterium]
MDEGPPGLTRRERERLRHRAEILDAARKVIEARGLSGLTIEEVARQAEFAVGSIYRHFRSKDEMVELLVVHLAEPMCEQAEAAASSSLPFEAQLDMLLRGIHAHFVEEMPLLHAFHAASGPVPAEGTSAGDRLKQMRTRCVEATERVLQNGQAEGVLPAGDVRPMTIALIGLISGFVRWSAYGFPADVDAPAAIHRLFLDGARRR